MLRAPGGRLSKLWAALVVLSVVVAMTAACDGGGSDGGSPTPGSTASASPAASPATATAPPCQSLASAKTFRYVSKVTLESPQTTETPTADLPLPSPTLTRAFGGPFLYESNISASVVSPDRFHFTITTTDAPAFEVIAIGQEVWQQVGGTWEAQPLAAEIPYQPIPVCEAILPELDLSQTEPQREEVDGLETLHYNFLKNASSQGVAKVFGENSDMDLLINTLDVDLWLSDDGEELVRLEFQGKGLYSDGRPLMVHLVLDVRDINDKDIKVEPPT
jgi:hypothetical protein